MCIVWSSPSQRMGIIFFFRMITGLIQFGKSIQNFVTDVNSLKVIDNKNRKVVNVEWKSGRQSNQVHGWQCEKVRKNCVCRGGFRKVSVHFKCLDCQFFYVSFKYLGANSVVFSSQTLPEIQIWIPRI